MESNYKIGVYLCHCGRNISSMVNMLEVHQYVEKLEHVAIVRECDYMCSTKGHDFIRQDIRQSGINRVVIAACSPRLQEQNFQNVLKETRLNPYLLQIANIREQCTWLHQPGPWITEKVKRLINGAIKRVINQSPGEAKSVSVFPATLVIGGGIAGIQAALEIASSRHIVYLVEREPSIGGHMAQFDHTFPNLDCSVCLLTPKTIELINNPYIRLMTYSEVVDVSGYIGNFVVKVKRKARYVDEEKCVGCGVCQAKCPWTAISEFDAGLGLRKAIYFPFPQAIPSVPVIDRESCYYFTGGEGKCRICEQSCDSSAVNFQQQDLYIDFQVGSIIVATGFDVFNPTPLAEYGYGQLPNVFTSLEFERLCCPSGPTRGKIKLADGREPKSVAIIHCVGSRDKNYHAYCSKLCCMVALKYAYIFREETGGEVYQIYTDMCYSGKGYDELYQRVKDQQVNLIRGQIVKVSGDSKEAEMEKIVLTYRDLYRGDVANISTDMVILCTALEPRHDSEQLAKTLHLGRSSDGFFLERNSKIDPISTMSDGIFIIGCCQGPKDIPETISQASAAAAKVLALINRGKIETGALIATVNEAMCSGCGICQDLCPYGAISTDEQKKIFRINEVLCKGCNICGAACPSAAISTLNFSRAQILAEIEGVLS
jgi:heterodisulfide reductase subunit A